MKVQVGDLKVGDQIYLVREHATEQWLVREPRNVPVRITGVDPPRQGVVTFGYEFLEYPGETGKDSAAVIWEFESIRE